MKAFLFFISVMSLPIIIHGQQTGFRKLYSGETTAATFVDIVWDGEKLITTGQFLTDTAPNNALNGLLYMELDTNGNSLFTDIYFHPNDAVTPQIGNCIYKSTNSQVYSMGQILDVTSSYLSIYNESERVSTLIIPVDGQQSWLYHCVDWNENILLSGRRSNNQYDSEGMLIKSDPLGTEIWRRYYGSPGLDCYTSEPYIIDANTILLPGRKAYWPSNGPVTNKWTKTWMVTVDSLGNIKSEWESQINIENGVSSRILKMPDGNWLYATSEFIPMPGQIDSWGTQPKIVCRDINFNLIWERYISSYPSSSNYLIDLQPTIDGNYLMAGRVATDEWWGGCIVHKFTPSSDSLWTYFDSCEPFLGCYHYLGGVAELPSGSVVAAGYYENVDEVKTNGLLIKLDKNGCLDTLCGGEEIGTFEIELASKIKVFPNPASRLLTISNPIGEQLELFDLSGKLVRTVKVQGENETLDIHDLPTGAYLVKMHEKTLHVSYKIIKK
jgi:hypothetical protein